MSHRFDADDLCEDLLGEEDVDDRKRDHGCGCKKDRRDDDVRGGRRHRGCCNNKDRDRDRDRDRRRRDRFIPIGTVTVDCTPVIFKSNQCPCPRRFC